MELKRLSQQALITNLIYNYLFLASSFGSKIAKKIRPYILVIQLDFLRHFILKNISLKKPIIDEICVPGKQLI